jgi:hypothetical protein
MTQETFNQGPGGGHREKAHLFLVSCPHVAHSKGNPITYLFVANASCPLEARQHENWGLVERVRISETEIVRGGIGEAKMDLESKDLHREWRILVGNKDGLLFQEKVVEGEEGQLEEAVKRIPHSVLLIQDGFVEDFTGACRSAEVSYQLHVNRFALCADCVEFGCEGCSKKSDDERDGLEGEKFHLV